MSEEFSPQRLFELYNRMWNPAGNPLGVLPSPFLSAEEIDKKIGELKLVEQWLATNLEFLRLTIKTLEFQKAVLSGLKPAEGQPQEAPGQGLPFDVSELWPWNMLKPEKDDKAGP